MKGPISCKKLQNGKINFNRMFKKLKGIYKMKEYDVIKLIKDKLSEIKDNMLRRKKIINSK
jgi:hypothetical protein